MHRPFPSSHLSQKLANMLGEMSGRFNDFNNHGSGWVLADCLYLDLNVGQCVALAGSCSTHRVSSNKSGKLIINEEPREENHPDIGIRCFFHAVATYFLHRNSEWCERDFSLSELESFVKANLNETIESPVSIDSIDEFEKANEHMDIAVNIVYKDENGQTFPCRASPRINAQHCIVLLLFHKEVRYF